jgi:hypothetical protein
MSLGAGKVAHLVKFAQVLDSIGADLNGNLGDDGNGGRGRDSNDNHGGPSLSQLGVHRLWFPDELAIGALWIKLAKLRCVIGKHEHSHLFPCEGFLAGARD